MKLASWLVASGGGVFFLCGVLGLDAGFVLYGVRSGSHGPGDLSPIAHAAALHVDLTIPNFGIQEYMGHRAGAAEVFTVAYRFRDGYMHPGDAPGLGVSFDEEAAGRYPYSPKYLPVNRRRDGSMHDW